MFTELAELVDGNVKGMLLAAEFQCIFQVQQQKRKNPEDLWLEIRSL